MDEPLDAYLVLLAHSIKISIIATKYLKTSWYIIKNSGKLYLAHFSLGSVYFRYFVINLIKNMNT